MKAKKDIVKPYGSKIKVWEKGNYKLNYIWSSWDNFVFIEVQKKGPYYWRMVRSFKNLHQAKTYFNRVTSRKEKAKKETYRSKYWKLLNDCPF